MNDNEKDIQDLIRKFSQQTSFMGNNPIQNTNQGIDSHSGIDNQGTISESTPLTPGMVQPKVPVPIPTGNVCSQCNMMHPPLRPGEKCPNAIAKQLNTESEETIVDVNKYLVNLQNILMSQIDKKKIKDINKLFQNITLEITKFLEVYEE